MHCFTKRKRGLLTINSVLNIRVGTKVFFWETVWDVQTIMPEISLLVLQPHQCQASVQKMALKALLTWWCSYPEGPKMAAKLSSV